MELAQGEKMMVTAKQQILLRRALHNKKEVTKMYNPCFECWNRYGKQYSEECDNSCEYAVAVKVINNLQDEINKLKVELEYHCDCR